MDTLERQNSANLGSGSVTQACKCEGLVEAMLTAGTQYMVGNVASQETKPAPFTLTTAGPLFYATTIPSVDDIETGPLQQAIDYDAPQTPVVPFSPLCETPGTGITATTSLYEKFEELSPEMREAVEPFRMQRSKINGLTTSILRYVDVPVCKHFQHFRERENDSGERCGGSHVAK